MSTEVKPLWENGAEFNSNQLVSTNKRWLSQRWQRNILYTVGAVGFLIGAGVLIVHLGFIHVKTLHLLGRTIDMNSKSLQIIVGSSGAGVCVAGVGGGLIVNYRINKWRLEAMKALTSNWD